MRTILVLALLTTGCGSLRSGMIAGGVIGTIGEGGVGYAAAPSGKKGRAAAVGAAAGALSGMLIVYGLHGMGVWRSDADNGFPPFDGRPGGWLLIPDGYNIASTTAAQEERARYRKAGFPVEVLWPDLLDTDVKDPFLLIFGSYPTQLEAQVTGSEHRFYYTPIDGGERVFQARLHPGSLRRLVEILIQMPPGPAERTTLAITTPERSAVLRAAPGGEASIWVAHAGKVTVDVRYPAGDATNPAEQGRCFAGSTHAEALIGPGEAGPPETTPPVRLALGHHAVPCR
jgi:hypothetical protein